MINGGSSYGHGPKEEVDEHIFFSEAAGTTMRNNVTETSLHDSWQLTMGSPALLKQHRSNYYSGTQTGHSAPTNYLQLNDTATTTTNSTRQNQNQYYALGCDDLKNDVPLTTMTMMEREDHQHQHQHQQQHQQQPKKVMHHFFDEWPPKEKDSWIDSNGDDDDDDDNDNNKLGSRSHHHQHHHHLQHHQNHNHHHAPASKIQLSISMPNTSHDFFMTRNGT